jgi:hypothetical protein
LITLRSSRTGSPVSSAGALAAISSLSSAASRPWSWSAPVERGARNRIDLVQQLRKVDALRLPVRHRLLGIEPVDPADHFRDGAEAHLGHDRAQFFGHEEEVVDDVLRLAGEARAQHRVLRGHAHRAGVEVALAHHDAAGRDQRRGGEAELVRAQQRGDGHVASGADAAVRLHADARTQVVEQQRLLRLGQTDFPRRPGVGQRGQRRGAGAAFVARDRHVIRAPWKRPPPRCPRPLRTPA